MMHNTLYRVERVFVHAGVIVGDLPCIITAGALRKRLCCEPTVRVRRSDIISRWRESCDLTVLIYERGDDWHEINVLGNFVIFTDLLLMLNVFVELLRFKMKSWSLLFFVATVYVATGKECILKTTIVGIYFLSLFFSKRLHICYSVLYAIAHPSVCPSHRWISHRQLKLGSCNFHHRGVGKK